MNQIPASVLLARLASILQTIGYHLTDGDVAGATTELTVAREQVEHLQTMLRGR